MAEKGIDFTTEQHRAARDAFNACCSECKRAVEWTSWRDEPMICGPCMNRIGEAARWGAIMKAQR